MLPAGTEVEGAASPYTPLGAPRISYASPPYSGGLALKLAVEKLGRQERAKTTILPLPLVTNDTIKLCQEGTWAGNEGRLQRVQTFDRAEPRMVCVDLLGADAGDRPIRRAGGSA